MWKRPFALALSIVLAVLVPGASSATSEEPRFRFHVANAYLTGLTGIPQTGARAETTDGVHVIRFSGKGVFAEGGPVRGGGVWAHSSGENDDLFAFGTWRVTGLDGFESFGCGGDGLPSDHCGGILRLTVHLSGVHLEIGPEQVDGILTIVADGPDAPTGTENVVTFTPVGVPLDFDRGIADPAATTLLLARS
jgi:hypothetical protein